MITNNNNHETVTFAKYHIYKTGKETIIMEEKYIIQQTETREGKQKRYDTYVNTAKQLRAKKQNVKKQAAKECKEEQKDAL